MPVDLNKDRKALLAHIKARVQDYPVYVNEGPGNDEDDVTQLTLGFQFDQAGWVALVFDTRDDASIDGEWQQYIEENVFPMEHWRSVSDSLYMDRKPVIVTSVGGKRTKLQPRDDFAQILGEMLRDLLVECFDQGVFKKLPLSPQCLLTVEEHDGAFGWTNREDNDKDGEDPFAVTPDLVSQTAKLSTTRQIKFWLERLRQIAADTEADPDDYVYDVDSHVDALEEIGVKAVVPMLQLAVELSTQPEFDGDAPGDVRELYRSTVLQSLLQKVDDMEHASPSIEKLLRKVVAQSVKVNAKRRLSGVAPFFAAQALFNLFDRYPCPEMGDQNELLDPDPYLGNR